MWHTLHQGKAIGPFTDGQMQVFIRAGRLRPTHYVWKAGMPDWMPANRFFRFHQASRPIPRKNYPNPYGDFFAPTNYGHAYARRASVNRVGAAWRAIFLGALGVHKFYLGYNEAGTILVLFTLFTCGYGIIPMVLVGLTEGIILLSKSDEEFYLTYVEGKRDWM